MNRPHTKPSSSRQGFTLAEILLAMLVFAIAISTILALLARSIETADEILVKDEAIGLSSAVDAFISELPFYKSGEANAYQLVQDQSGLGVVVAYDYLGTTNSPYTGQYADGTLQPFTGSTDGLILGEDYQEVSGVRIPGTPEGTAKIQNEIGVAQSRVFVVLLQESEANPYRQQNPSGTLPANPDSPGSNGYPVYDSAVLVVYAQFFNVPGATVINKNPNALRSLVSGREPAFAFNFAVRR